MIASVGTSLDLIRRIAHPTAERIWSLSLHNSLLAVATNEPSVHVYRFPNHKDANSTDFEGDFDTIRLTGHHKKTVRSVAFSPNGRFLASCSFDGLICIWLVLSLKDSNSSSTNMHSWPCVATLEGHENEVKGVAWSADSHYLASCGRDRTVWIWSASHSLSNHLNLPANNLEEWGWDFECQAVLQEHAQDVKSVAWHPSKPVVASGAYDETVKVITGDDGELADPDWTLSETIDDLGSTVWAIKWSGEDSLVGGLDTGELLFVTLAESGKKTKKLAVHAGPVYAISVCLRKNSHLVVASAGEDRCICLTTAPINDTACAFTQKLVSYAHSSDINALEWSSDGCFLFSGSDDGTVGIWHVTVVE